MVPCLRDADLITAGPHLYESQLEGSDQRRLTTQDRVAWQNTLQTGRSHVHLLCRDETRESADRFAGLVWRKEGTENVSDQTEVVEVLRTLTKHVRREIRAGR